MGLPRQHRVMDEVELVEDEPADVRGRVRRVSRRWAMTGSLGVLVGAAVTVVLWTQPGGDGSSGVVLGGAASLVAPLTETWRVRAPQGWSLAGDVVMTTEDHGARVDVTAYDPSTGTRLWQVVVEPTVGGVRCPAQAAGPTGPVVVCQILGGLVPSSRLRQDRAQDPGRLLLLSVRDGAPAGEIDLPSDHVGYAVIEGDLLLAVQGATSVGVERRDLGTGEPVWVADLALEPVLDGDRAVRVDLPAAGLQVQDRDVLVTGPLAAVLDGHDGAVVGVWRPGASLRGAIDVPRLTATATGFAVQRGADVRPSPTSWYTAAGDLVGTFDGTVAEPAVTDRSEPGVVLSATPWWGSVRAVDVELGEVLWSVRLDEGRPVVRVRGAVVLASDGHVQVVDLRTGEQRWAVSSAAMTQVHPVSDGTVVLATGPSPAQALSISAISVADGRVLWRTAMPQGGRDLEVLDGQVVAVGPGVLIGLG